MCNSHRHAALIGHASHRYTALIGMAHAKERDENVSKWITEGSLKSYDHVTDGMDNAIEGFLGMLEGKNPGKSILKIVDPE
jgi:NADPH-dependent curcumin reductase CurA